MFVKENYYHIIFTDSTKFRAYDDQYTDLRRNQRRHPVSTRDRNWGVWMISQRLEPNVLPGEMNPGEQRPYYACRQRACLVALSTSQSHCPWFAQLSRTTQPEHMGILARCTQTKRIAWLERRSCLAFLVCRHLQPLVHSHVAVPCSSTLGMTWYVRDTCPARCIHHLANKRWPWQSGKQIWVI